jgi:hypothetical protein
VARARKLSADDAIVPMHDQLARLGCDTAQGYSLSRPLPPAELAEWLARAVKPIHEAAA